MGGQDEFHHDVDQAHGEYHGTVNPDRVEAPVTAKAYMACAFAAFGGIFFGFDSGK